MILYLRAVATTKKTFHVRQGLNIHFWALVIQDRMCGALLGRTNCHGTSTAACTRGLCRSRFLFLGLEAPVWFCTSRSHWSLFRSPVKRPRFTPTTQLGGKSHEQIPRPPDHPEPYHPAGQPHIIVQQKMYTPRGRSLA